MTFTRVLFGGKVYTADDEGSWAEAVALEDGFIWLVGSTEDVLAKFPDAEKVDLAGFCLRALLVDPGRLDGIAAAPVVENDSD